MKFNESWLRERTNPDITTQQLADQLTLAGLEVDSIEPVAKTFSSVIIGHVVQVEKHPNADKLSLCSVEINQETPLSIICGASNVKVGIKVPVAMIKAELPGGFKIKKTKLRGVLSEGMICSAKELSLEDQSNGIMILPDNAPVGESMWQYLNLDDTAIEVDLTPNRGDCLSIDGLAREVSVLNHCPLLPLEESSIPLSCDDQLSIQINAPIACHKYTGRIIKGINPDAETPIWMKEKLRRCGVRCISPIVDITNYIMLELGQPMHAFDLNTIANGIIVRNANQGETITLLDDQTITLREDTLVIADHNKAIALAGIMGGHDTAVTATTTDIFLESAHFSPHHIAGKARSYGLHTDSSHRFERGVDITLPSKTIERATQFILTITGGTPGPVSEIVSPNANQKTTVIQLKLEKIKRVLGIEIPVTEVETMLTGLGMKLNPIPEGWEITPPSHRFDMEFDVDLIEELIRLKGFDQLPYTAPRSRLAIPENTELKTDQDRFKDLLVDRGYYETITYSFVNPELQHKLNPDKQAIKLANPIASDMSEMRVSQWSGLIQAALYNFNRQQNRIRLFECGLGFYQKENKILQEPLISAIIMGDVHPEQWAGKSKKVDFYDIKADVEAILKLSKDETLFIFESGQHPALHPGQCAKIRLNNDSDTVAGWLGMLHPKLKLDLGFPDDVFLFELDLNTVLNATVPKFKEISKFPSIRRDLSIIIDENVTNNMLVSCIKNALKETINDVIVFDVYQGEGINDGEKSVSFGVIIQDVKQTLTDSEIEAHINNVITSLQHELKAKLRG